MIATAPWSSRNVLRKSPVRVSRNGNYPGRVGGVTSAGLSRVICSEMAASSARPRSNYKNE
jgi:hypothetical protein